MQSGRQAAGLLLFMTGVLALFALPPFLVAGIHEREVADLTPAEAIIGTGAIAAKLNLGDPTAAYPAAAREQMPTGLAWWALLLLPGGVIAGAAAAAARPLDVWRAKHMLGRRGYDIRGSRPREWARPRDVAELVVKERSGKRMTLGTLDRRLLAGDPEAHTLVCAAPRAGKTTGYVIPWLLEHDGPAVVTSTKHDVWRATEIHRAKGGRVWVYDPFSSGSCCWNPLEGCEDWSRALRQAHWLTDAASRPGQGNHVEEFWSGEASKLLAPLLHAAALAGGDTSIGQVVSWLETDDRTAPVEILRSDGDPAAKLQLEGVLALDPRNVGTTYMSTAHLLHAYRFPEVLRTATDGFTADHLLDGSASTLYLTSSSRHQKMLAPILVALVSSVLDAAIEKSRAAGKPLDPLLRVLLDEVANCAPLGSLPGHLSDVAAHGVRIATIWQSVAQMRDRYGDAKDTIMAASTDKLFLGPITDKATRDEVVELLGRQKVDVADHSTLADKATAQDLQQLTWGRALVVSGSLPPAVARFYPHGVRKNGRTA